MQDGKALYAVKAAFWFALVYGGTGWLMFSIFHNPAKACLIALSVLFGLVAAYAILALWRRFALNANIWSEYPVLMGVLLGGLFMFGTISALPDEAGNLELVGGVVFIWLIPALVLLTFGFADLEAVKRMGMGLGPYPAVPRAMHEGNDLHNDFVSIIDEATDCDDSLLFPGASWNIGSDWWALKSGTDD